MKKILLFLLFLFLNINIALAVAPDLTVSNATGFPGKSVSIPVIANLTTGLIGFQFDIQYDPTLLTFSSVSLGTADVGWYLFDNHNVSGKVRIGSFNIAPITGNNQQLILLNFTINTTTSSIPITIPNIILSNAQFNEFVVTNLNNGTFISSILGDVDGDNKVTSADATTVAKYVLGLQTLTPNQILNADVSGNGKIDFYDVALIAQYANGVITKFP